MTGAVAYYGVEWRQMSGFSSQVRMSRDHLEYVRICVNKTQLIRFYVLFNMCYKWFLFKFI